MSFRRSRPTWILGVAPNAHSSLQQPSLRCSTSNRRTFRVRKHSKLSSNNMLVSFFSTTKPQSTVSNSRATTDTNREPVHQPQRMTCEGKMSSTAPLLCEECVGVVLVLFVFCRSLESSRIADSSSVCTINTKPEKKCEKIR